MLGSQHFILFQQCFQKKIICIEKYELNWKKGSKYHGNKNKFTITFKMNDKIEKGFHFLWLVY